MPATPYPGPAAGEPRTVALRRVTDLPSLDVERADTGDFLYANTPVPAVGARPRTLAETLPVRRLQVDGQEPEAVVISLREIQADSRLNWVLQYGTRLSGGGDELFMVAWEVWQERASEPVDAWLPERDGDPLIRHVALAERELRLRRFEVELAARQRIRMILAASSLGMGRRQIGEVLGLSAARVQQLHDDASREEVAEVQRALSDARLLLLEMKADELEMGQLPRPARWGADEFDEVIAVCENLGLLEREGELVRVTSTGKALRDGHSAARASGRGKVRNG